MVVVVVVTVLLLLLLFDVRLVLGANLLLWRQQKTPLSCTGSGVSKGCRDSGSGRWQVAVACCNCCRSRLLKCLSNPIGVSAATVAGQRERGTESGSWRRRRLLRCRRRRFVCPRKMVHVFHGVVVHVNDNVVVVVVVVAGNEQDKMRCLHSLISLVHCPAKRSPSPHMPDEQSVWSVDRDPQLTVTCPLPLHLRDTTNCYWCEAARKLSRVAVAERETSLHLPYSVSVVFF